MDWLKRMNSVLDYIEDNLADEIKEEQIVKLSLSSKGIFQKIFTMITDMTLSEYIRKRRLTQAAIDIEKTNEKIIDIAIKYGYTSVNAFSSAFKKFHGITPSDIKKSNIPPKSFQRLTFTLNISVKGGNNDMQYRAISVELGKTKISDNDVIVELGKSRLEQNSQENLNVVGRIIKLDRNPNSPADVFVNGKLTAKGEVIVIDENFGVKIIEVIDGKNNILNFEMDDVIELDKNYKEFVDVLLNGCLIAKGSVGVIDGSFNVRFEEIVSDCKN